MVLVPSEMVKDHNLKLSKYIYNIIAAVITGM